MVGRFEQDTGGMESNRAAENVLETVDRLDIETYPIMRSYCCCLMLDDTLQST